MAVRRWSQGRLAQWSERWRGISTRKPTQAAQADDPWLKLSAEEGTGFREDLYRRDEQARRWEEAWRQGKTDTQHPASAPGWLYESSPYGVADEDGTLREVDSRHWRVLPARAKRMRVPTPKTASAHARSPMWLMQSAVAITLLAAVVYSTHALNPVAGWIRSAAAYATSADYTQTAWPALKRVWSDLESRASASEEAWLPPRAQAPVNGIISSDYSDAHPAMEITAASGAPVVAVAAGTVTEVKASGRLNTVVINHGSGIGVATYEGLASVSVRTGEYVTEGEVIGRLPTDHPVLTFSLAQNDQPVNPHQVIPFPNGSA